MFYRRSFTSVLPQRTTRSVSNSIRKIDSMPRLSDLLSERSDREKLNKIAHTAEGRKHPARSRNKRPPAHKIRVPDFVAVDLETTGLDKFKDRITEIGAVRFKNGRETESFSTLVNPAIPIPAVITTLTGISDDTVADAPAFEEVAEKLHTFLGDAIIVGHQVEFDIGFLREAFGRINSSWKMTNQTIDTAQLARTLVNSETGYALGQVAKLCKVALPNAHRALDDSRATGCIAVELIPRFNDIAPRIRKIMADTLPRSAVKKILLDSLPRRTAEHDATPHARKNTAPRNWQVKTQYSK